MADLQQKIDERRQQLLGDELQSRIDARRVELSKTENTGSAFGEMVGRSALDALFQSPKLLAAGSAGIQAPFSERDFGEIFEEEKGKFPANLATTTNEVGAAISSIPEIFNSPELGPDGMPIGPQFMERIGPRFDEELLRINAEEERLRQKFPTATTAGDIGGDVLALTAGRLPFAKGINTAETALAGKKFAESMTKPGTRKLVETVIDSAPVRSLMRGAGRVAETGAEAAILATLNGGDPLETAAFAAGGQATGSAILGSIKGVGKHPILASAFGMAALVQMAKETTPGGRDSFIDSLETGFEKVWWGLVAGATAAAAGSGRLRGKSLAENWPRFADAVATIPRATSISLLNNYLKATPDEQQTIDATLQQLQQDPNFFGPEITEKLQSGFENGNLVELLRQEL